MSSQNNPSPDARRFDAHETRASDAARVEGTRSASGAGPNLTMTVSGMLADSQGSSTTVIDNGRFLPGTMLGGRYRIVELLGRGGMGEVYRVDDLKLGQPICLKFLSVNLAADPAGLNSLYQETRAARLVGHANVCRVFDVGELDGAPFISMEYVDGENLKSLLQRIGRIPHDKAVEIARQLCRGLHAIHEQGLLHRDLKPTNIMLDGRGRTRITDFGLAAAAQDLVGRSNRAGTPAYMSPEQIAGRGVTTRSDIYALGLILYELFTGKRAFEGTTWQDYSRLHHSETPTSPSSLVHDLDPATERVILQCLEKDPTRRPTSAMAVLGALSGGDALAAVLAAGETPSPELVAAARSNEGIAPLAAAGTFVAIVAAVLGIAALNDLYSPLRYARLDLPPAVLTTRAKEIVGRLGYPTAGGFSRGQFRFSPDASRYIREHDPRVDRWQRLGETPAPLLGFWYRRNATPMLATNAFSMITWDDPPPDDPGMVGVLMDTQGALRKFYAVPPDFDPNAGGTPIPAQWNPLFELADLDPNRFEPAEPAWTPTVFSQERRSWVERQDDPNRPALRIDAGSYGGRVNFVAITGPWSRPFAAAEGAPQAFQIAVGIILLVLIGAGLLLAVHNIRRGRGDRHGGTTVALVLLGLSIANWLVGADHPRSVAQIVPTFVRSLGFPAFHAGMFWVLYMALEPTVRRRWPHRLVAWTRVVQGRWRDPLVGRDVLIGIGFGCVAALAGMLMQTTPIWFGAAPGSMDTMLATVQQLTPVRVVQSLLYVPVIAIFNGLVAVFIPLLFFIVVRREWLAAVLTFAVWSMLILSAGESGAWMNVAYGVPVALIWTVVALRFGLLAATLQFMTMFLIESTSLTLDWSIWFAPAVNLAAAAVLGLAAVATYVAVGDRPLFSGALLDA